MADTRPAEGKITRAGRISPELLAGLNVAALLFPMATAAGVIAYSPLGPDYVMQGAIAGMVCAAVGGAVASLVRHRSSGAVMVPSNALAPVQASVLGTIIAALGPGLGLHLATLPILILVTGILQVVFGAAGAARLVKFVPFPVISGFVSGIGALLLLKFGPSIVGVGSWGEVWNIATRAREPNIAVAIFTLMTLAIAFGVRKSVPRAPALMIALLVGIAVYQLAKVSGHAAALGATLGAEGLYQLRTSPFFTARWMADADLTMIWRNGQACVAIVFGAITLAMLGILDTVLSTRAAQDIASFPLRPKRDVISLGIGNLVSALVGSAGLSTSTSQTVANYRAGGRTRLSTLTASIVLLAMLISFPGAIGFVPLCAFPPIIIFVGWSIIDPYTKLILRRTVAPANVTRSHARRNALIHLSVLLPTALNQPLVGVGIGVVLSSVIFIVSMSRPIVRRERDSRSLASKRVRTRAESALLARHGEAIIVLDLEGPLFFGNAEDLAAALLAKKEAQVVILNLGGVTDIDATGLKIIEQARRSLAVKGCVLTAAQVPSGIEGVLREIFTAEHYFRNIDDALEIAENAVIRHHTPANTASNDGPLPLIGFDLCRDASPEQIETMASLLQNEAFQAGEVLCHQGDAADRIWLIRSGSVSVRLGGSAGGRRIAAFGPGITVGEMAVIDNEPRSASLIADDVVEAYVLTIDSYREIISKHPELASLIFQNISRYLSQRLRITSSELQAVQ